MVPSRHCEPWTGEPSPHQPDQGSARPGCWSAARDIPPGGILARYCIDILTQVNAVKAALDKVAITLIDDHVQHCVADAVRAGDGDAEVSELSAAIGRFLSG
jgi:Metal-sensitive transcriptional repressor